MSENPNVPRQRSTSGEDQPPPKRPRHGLTDLSEIGMEESTDASEMETEETVPARESDSAMSTNDPSYPTNVNKDENKVKSQDEDEHEDDEDPEADPKYIKADPNNDDDDPEDNRKDHNNDNVCMEKDEDDEEEDYGDEWEDVDDEDEDADDEWEDVDEDEDADDEWEDVDDETDEEIYRLTRNLDTEDSNFEDHDATQQDRYETNTDKSSSGNVTSAEDKDLPSSFRKNDLLKKKTKRSKKCTKYNSNSDDQKSRAQGGAKAIIYGAEKGILDEGDVPPAPPNSVSDEEEILDIPFQNEEEIENENEEESQGENEEEIKNELGEQTEDGDPPAPASSPINPSDVDENEEEFVELEEGQSPPYDSTRSSKKFKKDKNDT